MLSLPMVDDRSASRIRMVAVGISTERRDQLRAHVLARGSAALELAGLVADPALKSTLRRIATDIRQIDCLFLEPAGDRRTDAEAAWLDNAERAFEVHSARLGACEHAIAQRGFDAAAP